MPHSASTTEPGKEHHGWALPLLTSSGALPRSLTQEVASGRAVEEGCGVGSSSQLALRQREFSLQRRAPWDGAPVALDGPVLAHEKQAGWWP